MATLAGVTRVVDVSHHQDSIDVGQLAVDGVIARTAQAKGGQYGTTLDRMYSTHKSNALRGGKLFTSYFYLGSGLTPAQNAALHASIEPDRNVGVMLDWEAGSGDGGFLLACIDAFRATGYNPWGSYAPRWYWDQVGRPDLRNCPPLVSSRYKDNLSGSYETEYDGTPDSYWEGYGNNTVRLLQFTSVGRVLPYSGVNLDCNAFRGTRAELANWWNPNTPMPTPNPTDVDRFEEIMERIVSDPDPTNPTADRWVRVFLSGNPSAGVVIRPELDGDGHGVNPVWVPNVFAWGSNRRGIGFNPATDGYKSVPMRLDDPRRYDLPTAVWADIQLSSEGRVTVDVVG